MAEEAAAVAEAEAAEEAAAAGEAEPEDSEESETAEAASTAGAAPSVSADYIAPGAARPEDTAQDPAFDFGLTGDELLAMLTGAYSGVVCLAGDFAARLRGCEPAVPMLRYPKPDGTMVEVKLEVAMQRAAASFAISRGWNSEKVNIGPGLGLILLTGVTLGVIVIGAKPTAETQARREAEERASTATKRAEEAEALAAAEQQAYAAEERLRAATAAREAAAARKGTDG